MNSAQCGPIFLPESTRQSKDEIFQVNPMLMQKLRLAQKMVRIQILPVMSRTQRDGREVRGLLPQSPGAQDIRVCRFDDGYAATHSRTHHASQRPNPCQILQASVRTSPGLEPLLANRHSPFRRQTARQRGTPAYRHTSPKHNHLGWFLVLRARARPGTPQWHPEPGACVYRVTTKLRTTGPGQRTVTQEIEIGRAHV